MGLTMCRLIAVVLTTWLAVPAWSAGWRIKIVSAATHCPISRGSLCFDTPDTCLQSNDSGLVSVVFSVADSALITLSAIGYRDTILTEAWATAAGAEPTAVALMPVGDVREAPKMVVVAPASDHTEASYRQSAIRVSPDDIKAKAGAVEDIGRYLATLPCAVSSLGGGYDNTFFVRGGRPSEIVFLVDGIEMDNINHFSQANGSGGPIGFLNTDFVKTIQFFAGNMPVSYPSKMSSVVDIQMKHGSLDEAKQSVGVKLTGGMLTAEGPLAAGKSAYAFSGRYVDFSPLHAFANDAGIPNLGDLYGNIYLRGAANLDLSATGVLSRSSYRFSYPVVETADNGALFPNSLTQNETILQGGAGISAHYVAGAAMHDAHLAFSFRNGANEERLGSFVDTFFTNRYAKNPVRGDNDDRFRYSLHTKSDVLLKENHTLSFGLRASRSGYRFSQADETQHDGECTVCNEGKPVQVFYTQAPVEKEALLNNTEAGVFADYEYDNGFVQGVAGVRAEYYGLLGDVAASPRASFSSGPAMPASLPGASASMNALPSPGALMRSRVM